MEPKEHAFIVLVEKLYRRSKFDDGQTVIARGSIATEGQQGTLELIYILTA